MKVYNINYKRNLFSPKTVFYTSRKLIDHLNPEINIDVSD